MRVLLSVKPEFAQSIFEGTKKYEYRKKIFSRKDIKSIVVYASSPIRMVIGEFEVGDIFHEDIDSLWIRTQAEAGINKDSFLKYFADKSKGYAIEIETKIKYDSPLQLSHLMISSPPQSFCYLDF
jgi:predicted transcriptional regulator